MARTIAIELKGEKLAGRPEPDLLAASLRSVDGSDKEFLSPDYIQVESAFAVGGSVRAAAAQALRQETAADERVLVLELADGSTLVTSAARMQASLQRNRPELVADDGTIRFDQLQGEATAARGGVADVARGIVSKVFTLTVGAGGAQDAIIGLAQKKLAQWLGLEEQAAAAHQAELGVSWLGTKALMWAIEEKLEQPPGKLYPWRAGRGLDKEAWQGASDGGGTGGSFLIFIHGTGSSTLGSFGDLQRAGGAVWDELVKAYAGNIYGFEHRSLSESPIENALQLVNALPAGARISLVTHSRGGLVGDLLCLRDIEAHIAGYGYAFRQGVGPVEPRAGNGAADRAAETQRVLGEMDDQYEQHREHLAQLAAALAAKKLVIERYVRVASPAQGTKLASGNIDVFLSGLLSLIGTVPGLAGNPVYAAFKRVVIEVAKNRTNPHLVPGLEAMLPDAPMAALLRNANVQGQLQPQVAVLAGDTEGGNLLTRLGVMLTDFLLFDNVDNDLVVDTGSMLGGVAAKVDARVLFDRGAGVSHFNYFSNQDTRIALQRWLTDARPQDNTALQPLPARFDGLDALGIISKRTLRTDVPVVVLLPGIMGSYLDAGKDRVWLDLLEIARGRLDRIEWGRDGVEVAGIFRSAYGELCDHLAVNHQVELFPYDWRQPMDVLAMQLGDYLQRLMDRTQQPIRLLAHSMGGLVVRSCIHRRRAVMDKLMARPGARLVMLGTPHRGSHAMVENLLGKGDQLRSLARLDFKHSMQEILDLVSGFRGALQLLPHPDFIDTFQDQPDGGVRLDYSKSDVWAQLQERNTDFWFGDQLCGVPKPPALVEGSWLWKADGSTMPSLPPAYAAHSIYVFGVARNTPCGVRFESQAQPARLRMVGTARGDGTVTWDSGRIGGIGSFYYMPGVAHGDLLSTSEHFDAIAQLLANGKTQGLSTTAPVVRAADADKPVVYDPPPPSAPDESSLAAAFVGAAPARQLQVRSKRRLDVQVKAMDLRFVKWPVMVGHYEQDPISGPEQLIDTELLANELRQRHDLGLYPGPIGTAMSVLHPQSELERRRDSRRGAVVVGLGPLNGTLGTDDLRVAVRTGVLRYLLQTAERADPAHPRDEALPLATLLLGCNSAANITIADSLEALLRGVAEGNARFEETTKLGLHVGRLDIIELYLDTAITAAYELRELVPKLSAFAARQDTQLACRPDLADGEGWRPRLFDANSNRYWPRLIVTDGALEAPLLPVAKAAPAPAAPAAPASRPRFAEHLRFLYLAQRARVESVLLQRQPGVLEKLVARQIVGAVWNEDFGNTLFQLAVPHDLKSTLRQTGRMVLVVDSTTANLPWEMMLSGSDMAGLLPGRPAEEVPLAVRAPLVRQLVTAEFRRSVRETSGRTALVIGNPSVAGFTGNFVGEQGQPLASGPGPLPGAEAEAKSVALLLRRCGYDVARLAGAAEDANVVLSRLLRRHAYRILHVSAHGVYEQVHKDGLLRTGVVLSDGILITAAEVQAMEQVPELVFLNCCHLGQIAATRQDGNKLAASIARELIDIGVRCVIVAGWAVDDMQAKLFGETFYDALLVRALPFGEAVHAARRAVWDRNPRDITWGAFQAYGEPAWMVEPPSAGAPSGGGTTMLVSPDELLDRLAQIRTEAARLPVRHGADMFKAQIDRVNHLVDRLSPPDWRSLPYVRSALAQTWRDLQLGKQACAEFLAAIGQQDKWGRVPIRDVEQLANLEARLGAEEVRAHIFGGDPASVAAGMAQIERAIRRLDYLDKLVASGLDVSGANPPAAVNAERAALLGSAHKRRAWALALQVLAGDAGQKDPFKEGLMASIAHYQRATGTPGARQFKPYNTVNQLALEAMLQPDPRLADWNPAQAAALARHCGTIAQRAYAAGGEHWDAITQADALLVEYLCDGQLGALSDAAEADVRDQFDHALKNLVVRPWDLDSAVTQIEILWTCCAALADEGDTAYRLRLCARLAGLVELLQPERRLPLQLSAESGARVGKAKTARRDKTSKGGTPAKRAKKRP